MRTEHDSDYEAAHRLYSRLRDVAYRHALARCIGQGLVTAHARIEPITREALAAYATAWTSTPHWSGEGGWPWDRLCSPFIKKPRAFHVAVWSSSELCGLAAGSVSKGRRYLTLRYMEGSPHRQHPLRGSITPCVFAAAAAYAELLGVERMLLRNPLPRVQTLYRAYGFELAGEPGGAVYFEKTLA